MGAAEGGSSSVSGGKISSSSLSSLSHVHDLLLLSLSLAEDPEPHVLGHAARAILLACFSKAGFKGAVLRLITPHNVTVAVWIGNFDLSNGLFKIPRKANGPPGFFSWF